MTTAMNRTLYFSRNANPRLVVATARHLAAGNYPHIESWRRRLMALPAWADPFATLDAPQLPPASS